MKRSLIFIWLMLVCVIFTNNQSIGQTKAAPNKEVKQIQPTIMIIPYVGENGDLRKSLDSLLSARVAIIKIKEAFTSRGFTTVDFVAKLKASKLDASFMGLTNRDAKSAIVEGSGADIYVEVEINQIKGTSGNRVRLNLVAFDAFTGRDMGAKTSTSETMYTDQFDILVERAIYKPNGDTKIFLLEDFLYEMQEKFKDIDEHGRPIKIIFKVDPNSDFNYNTKVGGSGDYLKDKIEDWIAENAFNNNYHSQGTVGMELLYDEVRIPLRDENNRNFTVSRFARKVRSFCNTLEIDGSKITVLDDVRGGTIYITLQ